MLIAGARVFKGDQLRRLRVTVGWSYRYSKTGGHAIEVVGMLAHSHDLWNYGFAGPVNAEYFCQLLEVLCGGFSNGKDGVSEPAHAQCAQLLVKELNSKLTSKQWDILDDRQSDSPLLVFG